MSEKKYADISTLQALINNLKNIFAPTSHTHTAAQINATADDFGIYVQDTEPTDAVDGDIWVDTANDPIYMSPTIPEITAADTGKVLMVVNGTYQLVDLDLSVDENGVISV